MNTMRGRVGPEGINAMSVRLGFKPCFAGVAMGAPRANARQILEQGDVEGHERGRSHW